MEIAYCKSCGEDNARNIKVNSGGMFHCHTCGYTVKFDPRIMVKQDTGKKKKRKGVNNVSNR